MEVLYLLSEIGSKVINFSLPFSHTSFQSRNKACHLFLFNISRVNHFSQLPLLPPWSKAYSFITWTKEIVSWYISLLCLLLCAPKMFYIQQTIFNVNKIISNRPVFIWYCFLPSLPPSFLFLSSFLPPALPPLPHLSIYGNLFATGFDLPFSHLGILIPCVFTWQTPSHPQVLAQTYSIRRPP